MTENLPEGNQALVGDEDANPKSSDEQGQPSESDLKTLIATLTKRFDAQDGEIRALKGGKDRAVARMENAVNPLLEKLKEHGVDENKIRSAQRDLVIDELYAAKYGEQQPDQAAPGRVAETAGDVEVQAKVLAKFKLDANDPAVSAVLREHGSNSIDFAMHIGELAGKKASQPIPSGLTETPIGGGEQQHAPTDAEKEVMYVQLKAAYRTPTKSAKEIQRLEKALGMEG